MVINRGKQADFRGAPLGPHWVHFLMDIGGKITGIPKCCALGTTLVLFQHLHTPISIEMP